MICLGIDVPKDSITIAVLPTLAKLPTRLETLANNLPKLKKSLEITTYGTLAVFARIAISRSALLAPSAGGLRMVRSPTRSRYW